MSFDAAATYKHETSSPNYLEDSAFDRNLIKCGIHSLKQRKDSGIQRKGKFEHACGVDFAGAKDRILGCEELTVPAL